MAHNSVVYSVAFTRDGKVLASGDADGAINLWYVPRRTLMNTLWRRGEIGHESHVASLAFTPDGKTLVSGSADKTIRIWDFQISGESDPGPIIALWKERAVISFPGLVNCVAISPDGTTLAAAGSFDKVLQYDLATAKEKEAISSLGMGKAVAFSPDGRILACSKSDTVMFWDLTAQGAKRLRPTQRAGAQPGIHGRWQISRFRNRRRSLNRRNSTVGHIHGQQDSHFRRTQA